ADGRIGIQRMRIRLTLQWRVLLLVAGGMSAILILSAYLHGAITRYLIEEDHYNSAIGRTIALAERIAARDRLAGGDELGRDIQFTIGAHAMVKQIDVYQKTAAGFRLAASNQPGAPRLPTLDERSADNDLGEMEHPAPDIVTMEVVRDGQRYWI